MGKLFNLKEWLTVADTAQHLSIVFGENITEADVLRLALDSKLKLSINFPCETYARHQEEVPVGGHCSAEAFDHALFHDKSSETSPFEGDAFEETHLNINGKPFTVRYRRIREGEMALRGTDVIVKISGVWDLRLNSGLSDYLIEERYRTLIGINEKANEDALGMAGILISDSEGAVFSLEMPYIKSRYYEEDVANLDRDTKHYIDAEDFPTGSYLVVRTDALREFEESINGAPTSAGKPITAKERNTLLIIIAALAKEAKIDLSKPSKAGVAIAHLTEIIGAPVDHSTIEQKIKQIEDALESRAK